MAAYQLARHRIVWWTVLCSLQLTRPVNSDPGIKGPPHVSGPVAPRQTFRLGENVKLDCPIRAIPAPILEWSKDGDSVTPGWERFKTTAHGLRIKEATVDDSGTYTCKGVNGFGSEQITFDVIIVDPNESATEAPPIYRSPVDPLLIDGHFGGEGGHGPDGWSHLPAGGSMPTFTEISRTPGRLVQLTADSTLRLKCVSQGEPLPHLLWYKDGREINDERRSGRWGLQVPNIRPEDSGTYTCQAINPFGSINASFIIQVVPDRNARKPEFVEAGPTNVTAALGSATRLQCRVTSTSPPSLQWLKRLEPVAYAHHQPDHAYLPDQDGILQMGGWKYRVLRRSKAAYQAEDGSYFDKLALDQVSVQDGGSYICLATNSVGYALRETALHVVSGTAEVTSSGLPTLVTVVLPLGAVAMVALVACLVYHVKADRKSCNSRKGARPCDAQANKDLTAPCLPAAQNHLTHQQMTPGRQHMPVPPPSYLAYSTPFVGSMPAAQHPAAPHPQPEMLMAYSQETVRLHAGVNHGRPPTHSPRHAHRQPAPPSTFHPTQWPTLYRPPTYGRSVDGVVSYPPTESTESEHAYATVHSPSYENQMVASVRSGVANSRRFAVLKHMDMV